jgi:hypothetical protein
MESDPTSTPRMVWDPFVGKVAFERHDVAPPTSEGVRIPRWITTLLGLMMISGSLALLMGFFWTDALWFAVPALVVSVGGMVIADTLSKAEEKQNWLFFRTADRNGWAFRLIEAPVEQTSGGRNFRLPDPFVQRVFDRVPELCHAHVGQLIPFDAPQAMYWGVTKTDIPFWMGIQMFQMDAALAAEAIKTDAFGNRNIRGKFFNIIIAYDLDRDTGIRARLLGEAFGRDSRNDIKTESVEFNNRFNIAITDDRQGNGGRLALLRALTPATQATLIDLRDRYRSQLIIDGATIYFSGNDRILAEDETVIAEHFAMLLEQFAWAALSFKQFVE